MEILFVSFEPNTSPSDAAEVTAALPKALRGLGHKVTVVSPLFPSIDPSARSLARRLSTLSVEAHGQTYSCTVYDGRTTGGVDLIFLGNPELFGERVVASPEQSLLASLVFGAAVAQLVQKREPSFELIHAHDARAGAALLSLKLSLPQLPRVLSIHDAHDDLPLTAAGLDKLGLPAALREALSASSSLLGAAVRASELVVAGAPSTARAWQTATDGSLAGALREKAERLIGVVNGVDASHWNPLTDSNLSARFDPIELGGKARCKASLQYASGLAVRAELPLIALLGAQTSARGGDLVDAAASKLLRNEAQLVCVCERDEDAAGLRALAVDMPERVSVRTSLVDKERHLALAGADFLLLPAREPVGIDLALCALRYGTLPIVTAVGGLADTIVDADAKLETGSGFLVHEASADAVLAAVARALAGYAQTQAFDALRRRVMRTDVSWERSARRYEYAYRQLKR